MQVDTPGVLRESDRTAFHACDVHAADAERAVAAASLLGVVVDVANDAARPVELHYRLLHLLHKWAGVWNRWSHHCRYRPIPSILILNKVDELLAKKDGDRLLAICRRLTAGTVGGDRIDAEPIVMQPAAATQSGARRRGGMKLSDRSFGESEASDGDEWAKSRAIARDRPQHEVD